MAKPGTMSTTSETAAPVPGVPHFASKAAPSQRQNVLNVRVAPMKRLQVKTLPVKPDKPGNIGNF